MPIPAPRSRKLLVLAAALLALAGVSAQPPDGLLPLPLPPKSPGKADILPVLREARALPELPPPSGGAPALPSGPALPALPGELPVPPVGTGPALPPLPAIPAQPAASKPSVKYVNKPDVEFDFEVTKKGRAGVKEAALLMRNTASAEPGLKDTWKSVATKPLKPQEDRQTLACRLPADGRYEVAVLVLGENGRKATEATAEMLVVLDTKPPVVKDVRLDPPAAEETEARVRWTATDANLGQKCVRLELEQADGKWATLGQDFLNSGEVGFRVTDKLPVATRVRVTVTDLAGNSTTAASEKPTNLDPVVPEGRLTGVRAVELAVPPVPPSIPDFPAPGGLLPVPPATPEPTPPPIPKARG